MKNGLREDKRQAFMSFLESPSTKPELPDKKNNSDHEEVEFEQYEEQNNNCGVCGKEVSGSKKIKNCGFCNLITCSDHLRKRRRKQNKWQRICDNCEDKYLYDAFMKMEIKAEQAISVEEQIIMMKHRSIFELLQSKQVKRREVGFKTDTLNEDQHQKIKKLQVIEHKQHSLINKMESDQALCRQMEEYINRMEKQVKPNYQEDYQILIEEDRKLAKQLTMIEKKKVQVRQMISKTEKEFEETYEDWQKKQFKKQLTKGTSKNGKSYEKQKCQLF